jgi:hypothetical protein
LCKQAAAAAAAATAAAAAAELIGSESWSLLWKLNSRCFYDDVNGGKGDVRLIHNLIENSMKEKGKKERNVVGWMEHRLRKKERTGHNEEKNYLCL